ncbi:hypothetical protein [Sphingomonas sp. Root241]|uniref:hypothetical protein n=1 Tax=Sphingomonas sp. Root241 TaxID=1736501 RepID=UPI0012E3C100|nr:hypothetical protein [Sphingomonas sp. Root241]
MENSWRWDCRECGSALGHRQALRPARALKHAGPLTEHELPIDSHMLIAFAAPRPIFVGADTIDTGTDGSI